MKKIECIEKLVHRKWDVMKMEYEENGVYRKWSV